MENPFENNEEKRPTFLTVLCILTFIGSGWGVLSPLFQLFFAHVADMTAQNDQLNDLMENMGDETPSFISGMVTSSQAILAHARPIALCNLLLSLSSLGGAIMMFMLRRSGFYLYTAANVVALFVTPCFVGFTSFVMAGFAFSAVIALIFIILYAVNLRAMKY